MNRGFQNILDMYIRYSTWIDQLPDHLLNSKEDDTSKNGIACIIIEKDRGESEGIRNKKTFLYLNFKLWADQNDL